MGIFLFKPEKYPLNSIVNLGSSADLITQMCREYKANKLLESL